MSRDLALLQDILTNAQRGLAFLNDVPRERFFTDHLINYAVVRSLSIIGEAANHVSKETRQRLSQLDWSGMIGLRHVVVHDYGRVDLDEVWTIVHRDLPPLIAVLQKELEGIP